MFLFDWIWLCSYLHQECVCTCVFLTLCVWRRLSLCPCGSLMKLFWWRLNSQLWPCEGVTEKERKGISVRGRQERASPVMTEHTWPHTHTLRRRKHTGSVPWQRETVLRECVPTFLAKQWTTLKTALSEKRFINFLPASAKCFGVFLHKDHLSTGGRVYAQGCLYAVKNPHNYRK